MFQKLLASRSSEISAFDLLNTILLNVPTDALQPFLKTLAQILLTRLKNGKTVRYTRLITEFFATFTVKFGSQAFIDQFNSVQPGLAYMLILQVWLPRLHSDSPVRLEAKTQVIALTKLLSDSPELLAGENANKIWAQILAVALLILTAPDTNFTGRINDGDDIPVEIGYDATYSRLAFASKPLLDPFPEIADPSLFFAQSLHTLGSSQPGKIPALVNRNPKVTATLSTQMQKAGFALV